MKYELYYTNYAQDEITVRTYDDFAECFQDMQGASESLRLPVTGTEIWCGAELFHRGTKRWGKYKVAWGGKFRKPTKDHPTTLKEYKEKGIKPSMLPHPFYGYTLTIGVTTSDSCATSVDNNSLEVTPQIVAAIKEELTKLKIPFDHHYDEYKYSHWISLNDHNDFERVKSISRQIRLKFIKF